MSSTDIDHLLSFANHNVEFDKKWREVLASGGGKANFNTILDALTSLYWEGVEREIAYAIIAFSEFDKLQSDELEEEFFQEETLKSDKLQGLMSLWNPFDMGIYGEQLKPNIPLYRKVVEREVLQFMKTESLRNKRARALLQSLGLMDIDIVREHRPPSFRSWSQRPQIVDKEHFWRAQQCSECRYCIRSFHFYECTKGCLDHPFQRNITKLRPKESEHGPWNSLREAMYQIILATVNEPSAYILCPNCLETSDHPRAHLVAVRSFTRAGDKQAVEFTRELDLWEDELAGRSLLALGVSSLDRIAGNKGPRYDRFTARKIFPAGDSHCAVMFGPLLIENGVTNQPGGAFISHRTAPNFSTLNSKDIDDFVADPSEYRIYKGQEVLHKRVLSVSPNRLLFESEKPLRRRRFASMKKQVSGGLFTGYCDRFLLQEDLILEWFLDTTTKWVEFQKTKRRQKEYREELRRASVHLSSLIKSVFGNEISMFLVLFSQRLYKDIKLQYNRFGNHCQDFCNSLLFNQKGRLDTMIAGLYPGYPPCREQIDSIWFRYMMSYAGKMVHRGEEIPLGSPLTCALQTYDNFGYQDADIIDHLSSIRLKTDSAGGGVAKVFNGKTHDIYLLKDSEMTCSTPEGHERSCTMADHLLDGPHDNLSILTMHIHRPQSIYSFRTDSNSANEPLMSTLGRRAWIRHRLAVLHRLFILNTYLSVIARKFQEPTHQMTFKELEQAWRPVDSSFGRGWHDTRREGSQFRGSDWLDRIQDRDSAEFHLTLMMSLHASPYMQLQADWKAHFATLRNILLRKNDRAARKSSMAQQLSVCTFQNCTCGDCTLVAATRNVVRATSYAKSQEHLLPEQREYRRSHPDFVPLDMIQASIKHIGVETAEIAELFEQMERTPEYLEQAERK